MEAKIESSSDIRTKSVWISKFEFSANIVESSSVLIF